MTDDRAVRLALALAAANLRIKELEEARPFIWLQGFNAGAHEGKSAIDNPYRTWLVQDRGSDDAA